VSARATAILLLLFALSGVRAAGATRGYWLQVTPQDPAESLIKEAFEKNGFAGPRATAEALERISAAHAGTPAAGLSALAAGLLFVDAALPADAARALRHPDLPRTGLMDYALLALAEAQEASGDPVMAGQTYLAAADAVPGGPVSCVALYRGAEVFAREGQPAKGVEALKRQLRTCPDQEPKVLLRMAEIEEGARDLRAAAEAYDRLDEEHPASPEALGSFGRLKALAGLLPAQPPERRRARELKKALVLLDAGRYPEAAALFRALQGERLSGTDIDLVHAHLGRCLLALGRPREAHAQLGAVRSGSPFEAEAAFHLAKLQAQLTGIVAQYEGFAMRFSDTPWAEEALLALANHFQKDARDQEALPYYRRLLAGFPDGRYADRATWRVAWADYRDGRFDESAQLLERAARTRPLSNSTAGFLYWAGRARCNLGDAGRGKQLLLETVQRFKYSYHGLRAREALARLPVPSPWTPPTVGAADGDTPLDLPQPTLTRLHELLLIDRLDAALEELKSVPPTPATMATMAWIEWRSGRLRPAIITMRRAYPEAIGVAGDLLPDEVWRILYPLEFREMLMAKAASEALDPALVAALVCQESTFDPAAVSRAGARGLMQVMPRTGMNIARVLHVPYRTQSLLNPEESLEFGTHYLRLMVDQFGGRIERALAAYNAGPERVEAWTAVRPDVPAEEFVESIPFTETRNYVMTILAAQEQYRRIYSLPEASGTTAETARAAAKP
jgi:soluble lytic murein transglycosylase